MTSWHRDGVPVDDGELADLVLGDTDAVFEYDDAIFRFTAETVVGGSSLAASSGGTVVLALRRLDGARRHPEIYLVGFAEACAPEAIGCDPESRSCARANETACRAERRYVGLQLFQRAQELIDPGQAA